MSALAGLGLTLAVFIYAMNPENAHLYFHMHSFILIVGGTLTILLLSTPLETLKQLKGSFGLFFGKKTDIANSKQDLIKLSKNRTTSTNTQNELVVYAQDLWSQGINHDLFVVLLSQKRSEIEQKSVNTIQCLKNLAKYPPALGMIGTVIGMVSLFQSLDGNKQSIGPALALAMTATFLGLVVANAFVMPFADHLQLKHTEEKQNLTHIYQILLLIGQDEPQELVEDEVIKRVG